MSETVIDNLVIEISTDSKNAASNIDIVTASLNKLKGSSSSLNKATSGLSSLGKAMRGLASAKITSALAGAVRSINKYVENVNLFNVSMGKYADAAMRYAELVQDAMGVDSSEFIRNQAIFMQMAEGFGIASENAYKLSKGMTELAYDISSFYNVDMETSFQRLQSGLAGEIEPVRRWGIALDQASMKQWLMKKGIDANVSSLTQADKAMVRYNMMVETLASNGAIGDLARTLETPANAIRILQQQITQLSRAIGTLFIPVLIKVIPYVQAFVKVLTDAAQALANLLGIDISFDIDYSGLTAAAGGVADAYGDAASSAKKLKDYTMGFDELNIINPNTGASGVGAGVSSLGLEALSVWDDAIFDSINREVEDLTGKMKVLAGIVAAVGAGFLAWKIGAAISDGIRAVSKFLLPIAETILGFPPEGGSGITKVLAAIAKYKGPIAIAAVAITAVGLALYDLWQNSETFRARVRGVIAEVQTAFLEFKDAVWNSVVSPILNAFGIAATGFSDLYSFYIRPIVEKIAIVLVDVLGGAIVKTIDFFTGLVVGVGMANDAISTSIQQFATNAEERIESMKARFRALFEQIKRNTVTKVTELKDQLGNVWDKVIQGFDELKEGIRSRIDSIKGFFSGLVGEINSAIRALEDFLTIDIGNTSIGINIPEIGSGEKFGLSIDRKATGGFLEDGLFTMNHGEIAGRFSNGQSVVANNQQIIEGIAQGVYEAFVRANSESGDKPVQVMVYLDGKQITSTVNKKNNERGRTIMGNALGYNY